jgi:hypothetical protein
MKLPKKRKFKPGRVPIEEVEAFLFAGGKTLSDWRITGTLLSRESDGHWWLHTIDNEDFDMAVFQYLREHGVVEEIETECAAD